LGQVLSVHSAGLLYVVRLKTVGWPAKVRFCDEEDILKWSS